MTWERNLVILGLTLAGILMIASQWPIYLMGILGSGVLLLAAIYAVLTGGKKWL